jgi:chromosome segregation ATPase
MEQLTVLEARVQAATQRLAGRHDHAHELEDRLGRLNGETARLRQECERLQGDLAEARETTVRLEQQVERTGAENRRLINEGQRFRDEIKHFEGEAVELRAARDRLTEMLDALVQAVETGEVETGAGEAAAAAAAADLPRGEVCVLPSAVWVGGAEARPARVNPDSDIPNEAARRLMDRIRERIEAHRA